MNGHNDYAPFRTAFIRTPYFPINLHAAISAKANGTTVDDRIRETARAIASIPEFRLALWFASPALYRELSHVDRDQATTKKSRRLWRSLYRYFARMSGRPTPFGLFAATEMAKVDTATSLALDVAPRPLRVTRLDVEAIWSVLDDLAGDRSCRSGLSWRPSSSLYTAGREYRYIEVRRSGRKRTFELSSVEWTPHLAALLDAAAGGKTLDDLMDAVLAYDETLDRRDVAEFVHGAIDDQILVCDALSTVSGTTPYDPLCNDLVHPRLSSAIERFKEAENALRDADRDPITGTCGTYERIGRTLSEAVGISSSNVVQCEVRRPAKRTLGNDVLETMRHALRVLYRFGPAGRSAGDALREFRHRFVTRYEQREVPLALALDDEIGIGFEPVRVPAADPSTLLKGIEFKAASSPPPYPWRAQERFLVRKLAAALMSGAREIVLDEAEVAAVTETPRLPLPTAFGVIARVADASPADHHVYVRAMYGPGAMRLLSRFAVEDDDIREMAREYVAAEESLRPDAIFAEIVHVPEQAIGSVVFRPVLRKYEIPYLGGSGVTSENQIAIEDLSICVRGERIVLRSRRLGREVIPRMTNPHHYSLLKNVPVYRFLCALQEQDHVPRLSWDWGPAKYSAPFLPRVTVGKAILSLAAWNLEGDDLASLNDLDGERLIEAVQRLRVEKGFPRWSCVAESDYELPFDLDSEIGAEAFGDAVRRKTRAKIVELFPNESESAVRDASGGYAHELIVPFVQKRIQPRSLGIVPPPRVRRAFPPGSEWTYLKIYTGETSADAVLREMVAPLVVRLTETGAIDHWFFLRHGDPECHIRLRLHTPSGTLPLQSVSSELNELFDLTLAWRVQVDTYEREIERYGGDFGIEEAERFFHADSRLALESVGSIRRDERWTVALYALDALVAAFGYESASGKARLFSSMARRSQAFFAPTREIRQGLAAADRSRRAVVEAILDGRHDLPCKAALHRFAAEVAPIARRMTAVRERLTVPLDDIVTSFAHLHVNRILTSSHRAHEVVLYDLLARHHESAARRNATVEESAR